MWIVCVCLCVTDVTHHDAVSFARLELRTGYVNGTCAPRIFWSVQLALSADPLTQTNAISKRQQLHFVTILARPLWRV